MAVVTRIETHGVRRVGCTRPNERGSTPWLAMPYRSREAMSMLMSAEFATANMPMNGKSVENGRPGAAAATTCVSADPLDSSARFPTGTRATAVSATST
jgi:hypothetical protein